MLYSIHDSCKQQCGCIRWLVYTLSCMHGQLCIHAYIQSMSVTLIKPVYQCCGHVQVLACDYCHVVYLVESHAPAML